MSAHGPALVISLMLAGCGRPAAPPPARRLATAGLVVSGAHVVAGPDLIRGVLRVRNAAPAPVALVDRWNSGGAYPWTLALDGLTAGNPQMCWWANFCSETVLAAGEVRHAPFTLHRRRATIAGSDAGWACLLGGPLDIAASDAQGRPIPAAEAPSFAPGRTLAVTLTGAGTAAFPSGDASTAPLYTGTVSAASQEVEAVDALAPHAQGRRLESGNVDVPALRGPLCKDGPVRTVAVLPKDAGSNYHYTVRIMDEKGTLLQEWELRNGVLLGAGDVQWIDINGDGRKDLMILGGVEAGERWTKTWLCKEREGKYVWINDR